jgi:hypothetical protein
VGQDEGAGHRGPMGEDREGKDGGEEQGSTEGVGRLAPPLRQRCHCPKDDSVSGQSDTGQYRSLCRKLAKFNVNHDEQVAGVIRVSVGPDQKALHRQLAIACSSGPIASA